METRLETSLYITVLTTCIKLLLIPSYRSTDFEVHRNWLAITYSLPLRHWYFEHTSEWTLDYPPFFAYFEWMLAHVAKCFDPLMLEVDNLGYDSDQTIWFMRLSVIGTDILLLYATWLFLTSSALPSRAHIQTFALVAFNAGLLLVDHIHFQYNGVLMGLLVLCLYFAQSEHYLLLAAAYSTLVLMKHLFVPLAPVYAVFLIQKHCMVDQGRSNGAKRTTFSVGRFAQLVVVAGVALGAAFGPFLAQANGPAQLQQILSRLFPFGRGLVHAYWAPNVWALYCAADKLLAAAIHRLNHPALNARLHNRDSSAGWNSASGLVGDFAFAVLPSVSPSVCLLILLLTLLPAMYVVYKRPTARSLLLCLVYASLSSFMWGYHVHEKAVIIPLLLQTFALLPATADEVVQDKVVLESVHNQSSSSSSTAAVRASSGKPAGAADGDGGGAVDADGDGEVAGALKKGVQSKRGKVNKVTSGVRRRKQPAAQAECAEDSTTVESTATTIRTEETKASDQQLQKKHALLRNAHANREQETAFLNKALFGLLATAGVFGLFPLFYTLPEVFTKSAIYAAYLCGVWVALFPQEEGNGQGKTKKSGSAWFLQVQLGLCLFVMVVVFIFSEVLHPWLFVNRSTGEVMLPFLPRLLTSVVCAVYLSVAWIISGLILMKST